MNYQKKKMEKKRAYEKAVARRKIEEGQEYANKYLGEIAKKRVAGSRR